MSFSRVYLFLFSDTFSSLHSNQFKSANDFLYSASLDDVEMAIIFKSPEVRKGGRGW